MNTHKIPIFRKWVGEWTARIVIFGILMTCLFSFAFYGSPITTIGYYGVQPTDVQYAMVVLYGSTVAFLALDFRIVKYFSPRRYLLMALVVDLVCSLVCFYFKDWTIFIVCQFIQGITCALMSGIVLQLIFPRLHNTRARVIAYSLLYGCIQISAPLYSALSSIILHTYDFNWLFYAYCIVLILLFVVILLTMNCRARFAKKVPLYQVDWIGYLYYVCFILIFGYILVYGRQLGWLDSSLIIHLITYGTIFLFLFILRECKMKRPLINFEIFKSKNFVFGLLLLFAFYIFKGSTGMTYGYVENILGDAPINTIPIWSAVIVGTVLGMFVVSRFILMRFDLTRIIVVGFFIMAFYYIYMLLYVSVQGESIAFILPMFIYGLATGVLFVPIVLFTASNVDPKISLHVAYIGIFARFTGFTASLAVNNELQLFVKSSVKEKMRESLTSINDQLPVLLSDIQTRYATMGNDLYISKNVSEGYFNKFLGKQLLASSTRDYYDWMLFGLSGVILILFIYRTFQYFNSKSGKVSN